MNRDLLGEHLLYAIRDPWLRRSARDPGPNGHIQSFEVVYAGKRLMELSSDRYAMAYRNDEILVLDQDHAGEARPCSAQ